MQALHLSRAERPGRNAKNKFYPVLCTISSLQELLEVARYDHVCGSFKNGERGNKNFMSADALFMDVDNDHSEKPADWYTPEKLHEDLPDVAFYVVYSKSHLQEKKGYSARPRFHVYYPLSETITDAQLIAELKERLLTVAPFDPDAKDAARFLYAVEKPEGLVFEGNTCIDEMLAINGNGYEYEGTIFDGANDDATGSADSADTGENDGDVVREKHRHGFLLESAHRIIAQYGDGEKAHKLYLKSAERCDPPSPVQEVNRVWDDCVAFVRKVRESKQRKVLTLPIIETTMQELGISAGFDVITKRAVISGLPEHNEFIPAAYYSLPEKERAEQASGILPLLLQSFFKTMEYSNAGRDFISDGLHAITQARPINPVRDMLLAENWDGVDRITKLHDLLNINDWKYESACYQRFLQKWLHQSVAMALNDGSLGCSFCLTLQGAQGGGKTTFFRKLAVRPEWFSEGLSIDVSNKDSLLKLDKVWIAELGELDSTLKREQASLKALVSAPNNMYRLPYGRDVETVVRRTSICATVNPRESLRDETGSRRFAFIPLKDKLDRLLMYEVMTPEWCAMLWRQVYSELYLVKGAANFYLDDDDLAFSERANEEFRVSVPGEIELRDALEWDTQPENWQWYTLTELINKVDALKDSRVSPERVGKAVAKILRSLGYDPEDKQFKRRSKAGYIYRLPNSGSTIAKNPDDNED